MGILKQQSLNASIVTYIGILLGIINVFVVFPLFLSKEIIGLVKALEAVGLIVVPFIYLGLPFAINKFYPVYKNNNPEKLKSALSKMYVLLIFNSVLISVLFYIFRVPIGKYFADKSPLLTENILLAIPVFLGMSWLIVLSYVSSSNLKIIVPRLLERVFIRVFQILLVLLLFSNYLSDKIFLYGISISYLLPTLILVYYLLKHRYLQYNTTALLSKTNLTEEIEYSSFITLYMFGITIIANIGMVFISAILGLEEAAIFFIAYYMGFILEVPANNFSLILKPVIATSLKNNDLNNVSKLYKKSAIVQTIISGLILILFSANINEIFSIMPNGNEYSDGKIVVLIIALAYTLKNIGGCHFDILIMSEYYKKIVALTIIISVATILLFYMLIINFGLLGAAWATFITIVSYSAIAVLIIYQLYKISPLDTKMFKLVVFILLFLLLSFALPALTNPFFSLIYKGSLIIVVYTFVIYALNLSEDINLQLKQMLHKISK